MARFEAFMEGKTKIMGESSGVSAGSSGVSAEDFPHQKNSVSSSD